MITVKILCACGQKYAFDVEPYNGRMPATVQCPICKADGTAAANEILARSLPPQPAQAPPPPAPLQSIEPPPTAGSLRIASATHAATAPTAAEAPAPRAATPGGMSAAQRKKLQAQLKEGAGGDSDNWKWWYYILAGICIAGFGGWKLWETHETKYVSGMFLAVLCFAIGIWDFNRKRAIKKQLRGQ